MLRIEVNLEKNYVDIWLAHDEAPPDLEALRALFPKYQIVQWRSGTGDLASLTAGLLRNNI